MKSKFVKISLAVALAAFTVPMFGRNIGPKGDLADAVRHELVMLPYYSVFDDFQFTVDNGTVTLSGDVTRPVLKSDAAERGEADSRRDERGEQHQGFAAIVFR